MASSEKPSAGVDDQVRAGLHIRSIDDPAMQPAPIYANNLRATFTPEDFTLHFGWYAIPPLDAAPVGGVVNVDVQPVARVVIPLNLMRSVIAVLQRQVAGYEENFGPIPEHPNKPAWMSEEESGAGD